MAEMIMKSGEPQPQSLLEKTNQLLILGKGTFVYLEFDSQAVEEDKGLTIYENTFRFTIPTNYIPVLVYVYSEQSGIIQMYNIVKIEYDCATMGDIRLVVCKPPEGATIDTSKHWKAAVVCLGLDTGKQIVSVSSSTGQVENLDVSAIKLISYSDTNGTDEITIQYADGSTETITVDKSNLWTVRPKLPSEGGRVA